MNKYYRTAASLALLGFLMDQANAQVNIGTSAGKVGDSRVFVGDFAGNFNNASGNTFVGKSAGQFNYSGSSNTYLGFQSGWKGNFGSANVYIGSLSGTDNDGNSNVFIGSQSGEKFKGQSNVILGDQSSQIGSGDFNVIMGRRSGNHMSGNYNVVIGNVAGGTLNANVSQNNTFVGNYAGASNVNSHDNSYFGNDCGSNNSTGSFNAFFGSATGNYNIGGSSNSFFGASAGKSTSSGSYNVFLGKESGSDNSEGSYNTYIGYKAGGSPFLQRSVAIGAEAYVGKANCIVLGKVGANVGIGVSAPDYQFQMSTEMAAKWGSPSWKVASDERLKKDVSNFTEGLETLSKIRPVWFTYNGKGGAATTNKFVGIIAQEMQKIAPYTIGSFTYQDSLGNKIEYLDYDANAVTYILINSVKEQQKVIEEKEAKIQEITSRLEQLERAVSALKPLNSNPQAKFDTEPIGNAAIGQNAPNGFSQNTSIPYFIPASVKNAVIDIYSRDGVKVGSYPIDKRGEGTLSISAQTFNASGVFIYDLVTDGKSNGTKKMMVNK
ncbi:tail fiber domain-containing protein [Dyadobacter luticola]|uniref:Tail fiber domain-containing protein n=1 Tax=Dyadobacter luticola TaxID=1979387 RepID=A0A5R9KNL1_9BACT|nr:tail fiber domain-containing protein [Dyadobacter luticola]TLU97862.1 tail fiber domain-containing protein [Dyadobacter luticola]